MRNANGSWVTSRIAATASAPICRELVSTASISPPPYAKATLANPWNIAMPGSITSSRPIIGSNPAMAPDDRSSGGDDPMRGLHCAMRRVGRESIKRRAIVKVMPGIAEVARIFYNWIIDIADALQLELIAASKPTNPSIDRKETHMAQDLQK